MAQQILRSEFRVERQGPSRLERKGGWSDEESVVFNYLFGGRKGGEAGRGKKDGWRLCQNQGKVEDVNPVRDGEGNPET